MPLVSEVWSTGSGGAGGGGAGGAGEAWGAGGDARYGGAYEARYPPYAAPPPAAPYADRYPPAARDYLRKY